MDLLSRALRQNAPANVYIAQVDTLSYIDHPKGSWDFFKKLFLNPNAMGENNGFYCVPYYTGLTTCGHWMMMIAHKQQENVTANFFDFMEAGTQHRQEQACSTFLQKLFTHWRVDWYPTVCTDQIETECGFRTIAVLHALILGIYANRHFLYI